MEVQLVSPEQVLYVGEADMVIARGMLFTIEFAPMNTINSLQSALDAIAHIGQGRARVLIDAMHTFRSGGTVADIAGLDPDVIGYAQLCDAPMVAPEGVPYFKEATCGRMVPSTCTQAGASRRQASVA